jgi:cytochrome c551
MTHAAADGSSRLRRSIAIGLGLAALVLAGAGCGGDDDGGGGGGGGAPATQTAPSNGGGGAAGDATAGAEVFEANCAVCHGPGGEGGNGPDLRADRYRDEQLVESQVVNGGGGMPAFGDDLSDQELADVVAYVTRDVARR